MGTNGASGTALSGPAVRGSKHDFSSPNAAAAQTTPWVRFPPSRVISIDAVCRQSRSYCFRGSRSPETSHQETVERNFDAYFMFDSLKCRGDRLNWFRNDRNTN